MLALTAGSGAAPDSPADYIARVEGPQSPNRQGFDPLTIEQLMTRFRVPGVSVAVFRDFGIHWAKGYGVAEWRPAAGGRGHGVPGSVDQQAGDRDGRQALGAGGNACRSTAISIQCCASWKIPVSEFNRLRVP